MIAWLRRLFRRRSTELTPSKTEPVDAITMPTAANLALCFVGKHDWTDWGWRCWSRFTGVNEETRLCRRADCLAQQHRYFDGLGRQIKYEKEP
jgi:hypothetical protein